MEHNKEKQIEEMAKLLCGMTNGCDDCMFNKVNCYERNDAEELYNAGFRKASEFAREIFAEIARYLRLNEDIAIKCKEENGEWNEEYWKGKLSAFKQIRGFIDAELKKKYTEEGK